MPETVAVLVPKAELFSNLTFLGMTHHTSTIPLEGPPFLGMTRETSLVKITSTFQFYLPKNYLKQVTPALDYNFGHSDHIASFSGIRGLPSA